MNQEESLSSEAAPSQEELRRLTNPRRLGAFDTANPSREAFLALGQSAESAAMDFDWRRMAANLENEIAAEIQRPRPLDRAPRKPAWGYVALSSAAMLLVALSIGLLAGLPRKPGEEFAQGPYKPPVPEKGTEKGIDSWERFSGAATGDWQDEIDFKLAATRRELRQGRDPWVNDEPALSEVFAQIGDLSAGLVFDPF
jgi:hypothetical protein